MDSQGIYWLITKTLTRLSFHLFQGDHIYYPVFLGFFSIDRKNIRNNYCQYSSVQRNHSLKAKPAISHNNREIIFWLINQIIFLFLAHFLFFLSISILLVHFLDFLFQNLSNSLHSWKAKSELKFIIPRW